MILHVVCMYIPSCSLYVQYCHPCMNLDISSTNLFCSGFLFRSEVEMQFWKQYESHLPFNYILCKVVTCKAKLDSAVCQYAHKNLEASIEDLATILHLVQHLEYNRDEKLMDLQAESDMSEDITDTANVSSRTGTGHAQTFRIMPFSVDTF